MRYQLIVAAAVLSILLIPCCLANPVASPFEVESPDMEIWALLLIASSPPIEALIALFLLWRSDRNMSKLFWIVTGTNFVTVLATTAIFVLLRNPIGVHLSYIAAEVFPVSMEIAFLTCIIPTSRSFKGVYTVRSLVRTFVLTNVVTFVTGVLYFAYLYPGL